MQRTSQDVKSAGVFYDDKVKDLGANIGDLEKIIQGKTNSLRVVEEGESPYPPPARFLPRVVAFSAARAKLCGLRGLVADVAARRDSHAA